ncbi:MAG: sce7726 family protein [Allosphingosinicella sp.]
MSKALKDTDVRHAAHQRLLGPARRCPDTLVVHELGLEHGASRVDIAVINGHIRGLEIKAETDTLRRLPRQVVAYGKVVDRATLIAAERHVAAATELLPSWWGIIAVCRTAGGAIKFRRVRAERINRELDALALVRLLWRPEVVDILRALGCDERTLKAPRSILYPTLVSAVSKTRLRSIVRTTLKARERWRDRAPPSQYGGSFRPTARS